MAAGTKKGGSLPRQSTTLLNFFTSDSSSSKKVVSTTSRKKPGRRRKSSTNIPTNPQDIIVIDSDSDNETDFAVNSRSIKKRRFSESSGEVEIVERLQSIDKQSCHSEDMQPPGRSSSWFGKPTSLLLSSTHADPKPENVGYSSLPSTSTAEGSFGKTTTLLLSSNVKCGSGGQHASPPCSDALAGDGSRSTNLDMPSELFDENEWGMGDDEAIITPTGEDVDDEGFELPLEDEVVIIENPLQSTSSSKSRTSTPKSLALRTHASDIEPKQQKSGSNAYSVLMSSHKENEAWKEATAAEDRSFRPNKANGSRRKAPFYKILQGMPIAVDAFKYGTIPGVTAYFLTHAHSDHYTLLSSSWNSGPIYCSQGTANLIMHMLKVDRQWVHPLPMDVPTEIPNTGGVRVTLIEANHCPGSCLFLFEGKQTVDAGDSTFKSAFVGSARSFRYLHCGDFRASPQHVLHPAVKGKRIDHVYLDTTYLDPRYTFPPQPLVISACAELAKRIANGSSVHDKPEALKMNSWFSSAHSQDVKGKQKADRVLMVVGTYSIGKERIVKAIAKALQTRVYCDSRKAAILRCQSDPELHALMTTNPISADVHIVPLSWVTSDKLKEYVARFKGHFHKAVGFRPTGWTYTQPAGTDQAPSIPTIVSRAQKSSFTYSDLHQSRSSSAALQMYPVPYSEHSSFFELTCFAMSFEWTKMIATVNVGSENSRAKMAKWVQKWEAERRKKSRDYIVPHRQPDYW